LQQDKNTEYSFKKVPVTIGQKLENKVEIIPDNQINASSKILTKGVFDLAN
jgi:cobalt-zinc-cadmium efflux system membrane fusion protein